MRNLLKSLIVVAVAVPALASAAVVLSKHDFSVTGGSTAFKANTETQVCKFCHASHSAVTQQLIWAKAASQVTGWAINSATLSGTQLPAVVQPASRLCLSCHDGVLTVGAMGPNAPAITGTGLGTALAGLLRIGNGTNFTGDHPVSVKYPSGTGGAYFTNVNGSGTLPAEYKANPVGVKLFTDPATGGGQGIECASCHDVHNNASAGNTFFLRVSADKSALCLACHTK